MIDLAKIERGDIVAYRADGVSEPVRARVDMTDARTETVRVRPFALATRAAGWTRRQARWIKLGRIREHFDHEGKPK